MPDLYTSSVPVFRRALVSTRHLLALGDAFATATGVSERDYLGWRLQPDMFDLGRQAVVATDGARGASARLAGLDPEPLDIPHYAVFNRGGDQAFFNPETVQALGGYIDEGIGYLDALDPDWFKGPESRRITWHMSGAWRQVDATTFLFAFAIPNLWFHVSMLYANLRSRGVDVGKEDYEGPPVYEKGLLVA